MKWNYVTLVEFLKKKNYRLTKVRSEILKVFLENKHLNTNSLITKLKERQNKKNQYNINVMSVYNSLYLFLQEGVISISVFNNRDIIFELSDPVLVHLVCRKCHKVLHLNDDFYLTDKNFQVILQKLEKTLLFAEFQPLHFKMTGYGICNFCQKQEK